MSAADEGYRPDIDGLRAVAVLSVVLYHAGVPFLPGGFVGVDIFFVISGYLITRILACEFADNRFSILAFYERRARRIFPALFVLLGASALAAMLIALPGELEEFGDSLAAATLFVSNIYFWQTADYFGGPAHLQPLLHTWSLAVEEQFYIVLPLLLLALTRWTRSMLVPLLLALIALSFALSVWGVAAKPNAAFYLLPTRFWELMAGALLALGALPRIRDRRQAEAASASGLALIVIAVLCYSNATAFPGAAALLPVLGAGLILHAGSATPDTGVGRLLSLRPAVFVGLISYSLYLWHWPVLTFVRIWLGQPLSGAQSATLVALSVALAALSWRYVEVPFRTRRIAPSRALLFRNAGAAMVAMLGVAAFATASQGWPERHRDYAPPRIAGLEQMNLATCFLKDDQPAADWAGRDACRSGDAEKPLVFVWGDSFAAHLMPGLKAELASRFQFVQYTASGCPPVVGADLANRPHCRAFNAYALEEIARLKPAVVLLSGRWDLYLPRRIEPAAIGASLERVAASGTRVVAIGASPAFDFASPYDYVYRRGRSQAETHPIAVAVPQVEGVTVFDPVPLFCGKGLCQLQDGADFLFFDSAHYSVAGSRRVARALAQQLDDAVAAGASTRTSNAAAP